MMYHTNQSDTFIQAMQSIIGWIFILHVFISLIKQLAIKCNRVVAVVRVSFIHMLFRTFVHIGLSMRNASWSMMPLRHHSETCPIWAVTCERMCEVAYG